MRRFKLPRRFPPTKEGWWFLVATLLVGAAAVNGGINLLFLIFGMMLFLILASGVMSELALKDLEVTRRPPASIHARTPFLMGMAVKNLKPRLPTFSLEVEDLLEGRPVERRCYYLKLPAGRTQETAYRHTLPRRGLWKLSGFRLSTRFPFGMIRKSRDVEASAELLVYPALVPVPDLGLQTRATDRDRFDESRPSRRGEFHGLREYRSGDDPRDIHWKASAKRGRFVIRESEEESGRALIVVLQHEAGVAPKAEGADTPFEAAVSLAASVVLALTRRGFQVGLVTSDGFLPPGTGSAHTAAMMKALALVPEKPGERPPLPAGRGYSFVFCRATVAGARLDLPTGPSVKRTA